MSMRAIDEKVLTKGELRKLNALRKSIGDELANEAFEKWYARLDKQKSSLDPNIEAIEKAIQPLINKVKFQRGAIYMVRRGRGRFIVELIELSD